MKKEIFFNILKLKRYGRELGLSVEEISVCDFYLENRLESLPKKILGLKVKDGIIDKVIIGDFEKHRIK